MNGPRAPHDRAGLTYWDGRWRDVASIDRLDPRRPGLKNYVARRFDRFFRETFASLELSGPRVRFLEVGCARSVWLPYFRNQFGFDVTGIDYSDVGCATARKLLLAAGAEGEILCADLFAPPDPLIGRFDVVFSNGLVEHFDDTTACVGALARFLKPTGVIITSIPNLTGVLGLIQKHVNRPIFDVHVPLDRTALLTAHSRCDLAILHCDYFMFMNSGIVDTIGVDGPGRRGLATRTLRRALVAVSFATWSIDGKRGRLRPNRVTSPYVVCVARNRALHRGAREGSGG